MKSASLALWLSLSVSAASFACGSSQKPPPDPDPSTKPAPSPASMPEVVAGKSARDAKRLDEARSDFAAALTKKPDDVEANYYLALTYDDLGEKKDAETYYKKTLELNPAAAEAATNLSALYLDQNRIDEAIAVCTAAIARSPQYDLLHFNLARARSSKPRGDGATPEFQAAIKITPDNPDFHLTYAIWLAASAKGDATQMTSSIGEANSALALAKEDADLLLRIGAFFAKVKDPDDCVKALDRSIARSDAAPARIIRGRCKFGKKDNDGAEKDLRAAIASDASSGDAYYWLGFVLHAGKRDDEAIGAFQNCQRIDPSGPLGKAATARIADIKSAKH